MTVSGDDDEYTEYTMGYSYEGGGGGDYADLGQEDNFVYRDLEKEDTNDDYLKSLLFSGERRRRRRRRSAQPQDFRQNHFSPYEIAKDLADRHFLAKKNFEAFWNYFFHGRGDLETSPLAENTKNGKGGLGNSSLVVMLFQPGSLLSTYEAFGVGEGEGKVVTAELEVLNTTEAKVFKSLFTNISTFLKMFFKGAVLLLDLVRRRVSPWFRGRGPMSAGVSGGAVCYGVWLS